MLDHSKRLLKKQSPFFYALLRSCYRWVFSFWGYRFTHYKKAASFPSPQVIESQVETQKNFSHKPKFSILVPVHNPRPGQLDELIQSVLSQTYPHWELIFAVDGTASLSLRESLEKLVQKEPRFRWLETKVHRHIAGTTQVAFDQSDGEWIFLLDQDDFVRPDALFRIVDLVNENPNADFIYSDHIEVDEIGRILQEIEKPDWDPILFLHTCYTNHAKFFRREAVSRAGGFRDDYYGAQDIDLICRVIGSGGRVAHLSAPIYYWRFASGSVTEGISEKPYVLENSIRSYNSFFSNRGLPIEVTYPKQIQRIGVGAFFWREKEIHRSIKCLLCNSKVTQHSLPHQKIEYCDVSLNNLVSDVIHDMEDDDIVVLCHGEHVILTQEGLEEAQALLSYLGVDGFLSLRSNSSPEKQSIFFDSLAISYLPRRDVYQSTRSWIARKSLLRSLLAENPQLSLEQVSQVAEVRKLSRCSISPTLFFKEA